MCPHPCWAIIYTHIAKNTKYNNNNIIQQKVGWNVDVTAIVTIIIIISWTNDTR